MIYTRIQRSALVRPACFLGRITRPRSIPNRLVTAILGTLSRQTLPQLRGLGSLRLVQACKARTSNIACDAGGPREILTHLARLKMELQCDGRLDDAWILTDRSSDFPVEPGLLQCNALACSLEPEPEPVQSVHPTLLW